MKILIIGATGKLGTDICHAIEQKGWEYRGVGSAQLDITNPDCVNNYFSCEYQPDIVILAAAILGLEKLENDPEKAYLVNSTAVRYVCEACKQIDASLVFISTDFVFDGEAGRPYTENDIPNATNIYGKTKILAEKFIQQILDKYFILRVAWLFSDKGNDYLDTVTIAVLNCAEFPAIMERRACPTYTKDIADRICEFIVSDKYGIYNVVNEGGCSQEELCLEVERLLNKTITLTPQVLEADSVPRPRDTRLCTKKMRSAGFTAMPSWQDAVARCLKNRGFI